MKKFYLLLLAVMCSVGMSWATDYYVYVCPKDVWSDYNDETITIGYQPNGGSWISANMTKTGFKDAGKVIYGYKMATDPNSTLQYLKFSKDGGSNYFAASEWGNSNNHVYHGYINNAHKWTDIPATSNASAVYLVGTFNEWANEDANYALTKIDGNHWKGTFVLNGASSNYEFKINAVDAPTGWSYQFSGNGFWFGTNTQVNQLWSNNGNDKIVPATTTGIFLIDVEYFGQYDNHGQLYVKTYNSTTINISAARYTTYYNSKAAYTMPSGCKGYIWDNGLVETYAAGSVVPAGEPLVIYSDNTGDKALVFTTGGTAAEDNALLGTDEETALEADANAYFYGLSLNAAGETSSVGFYWMNATGAAFTNGAHKAYLKLAKPASAPQRYFVFGQTDTATAVEDVETEEVVKFFENGQLLIKKNGVIYNAMGQIVK